MVAPSVGRRSCAGQREAAALISQSRRFHRRVKGLLYDGVFFFCRRPADVDKKFSKVDCNYNSLIVSVIAKLRMRFAGA